MSKLKSVVTKIIGVMTRACMRCMRIFMTKRAKLEALSAAIAWFVKRNGCKPLEFSHASDYGDFDVMSDGKQIQLTWLLPESDNRRANKQNPDAKKPCGSKARAIDDASDGSVSNDLQSMSHVVGDLAQTILNDFDEPSEKDSNTSGRR